MQRRTPRFLTGFVPQTHRIAAQKRGVTSKDPFMPVHRAPTICFCHRESHNEIRLKTRILLDYSPFYTFWERCQCFFGNLFIILSVFLYFIIPRVCKWLIWWFWRTQPRHQRPAFYMAAASPTNDRTRWFVQYINQAWIENAAFWNCRWCQLSSFRLAVVKKPASENRKCRLVRFYKE